jgi:ABC-2 type transport system permease protein
MIRNVVALTQRELAASFFSPVAYVVAVIFLIATGYLFTTQTLVEGNEATTRTLFDSMAWVLVFALPLLTMRVLADEYATGTIEALMTAPVTDVEVVLGKFLGVWIFYGSLLATTLLHVVVLFTYGGSDLNVVLYGYVGLCMLGALYAAVGVFTSSLTRYQLVAALMGMGVLAVFSLLVDAFAGWRGGAWRVVLSYVNILHHFEDFSKGIFDTKAILFFLSGTVFFLFLAVKTLECRRWR